VGAAGGTSGEGFALIIAVWKPADIAASAGAGGARKVPLRAISTKPSAHYHFKNGIHCQLNHYQ